MFVLFFFLNNDNYVKYCIGIFMLYFFSLYIDLDFFILINVLLIIFFVEFFIFKNIVFIICLMVGFVKIIIVRIWF